MVVDDDDADGPRVGHEACSCVSGSGVLPVVVPGVVPGAVARGRGTGRGGSGRGRLGLVRLAHGQAQLDLGAVGTPTDAGRAAVTLHPADDRLAHPGAVVGHGVEVEARAVVADERLDGVGSDLDVGADRRAGVAHGVPRGLAHGLDERVEVLVHRSVARDDELDGHAVEVLDLAHRRGEGGAQRAGTRVLVVEVAAQLSLLGPGEPCDGRGVAGLALDEGEGLEHRVVQVGGDVGALGGADAGRLLEAQVAPQPQDPRRRQDGHADERGEDGARDLPQLGEFRAAHEQADEAEDGQAQADDEPDPADRPAGADGVGVVELRPEEDRADDDGDDGQDELGMHVETGAAEPERAGDGQGGHAEQRDDDGLVAAAQPGAHGGEVDVVLGADRAGGRRRRGTACGGRVGDRGTRRRREGRGGGNGRVDVADLAHRRPEEDVDDEPRAEGDARQDERHAYGDDRHPEVLGEAHGDPCDDLALSLAHERGPWRRPPGRARGARSVLVCRLHRSILTHSAGEGDHPGPLWGSRQGALRVDPHGWGRPGRHCGDMTKSNDAPPQGHGLDGFYTALRRPGIVRRSDGRWFAGVATGLARWLGVDPLVVRAGFILFSIFFGMGVALYLVLWLLMPDERGEIHVERALKHGEGRSIFLLVVTAMAVLGGGPWWGGDSRGFRFFGFVLLIVGAWWFATRTATRPRADGPGAVAQPGPRWPAGATTSVDPVTGEAVTQPGGGTPVPAAATAYGSTGNAAANAGATLAAPRPAAPTPVRERTPSIGFAGGLLVLGLAIVTGVVLSSVAQAAGWSGNPVAVGIASGLGVLGLGILVAGLAGRRSGGLAFFAVTGMIAAAATTAAPMGLVAALAGG